MGCRPSKHATSKIRDAHARGINQCTCMYSPRKYNKKHKCNSNGTGSKRTSGGTQNGSHGHSSTGHRSRSYKSDESDFPAFSTTSAVYRRGASKASKITLRLSSDGSTLEIEQCDYSISNSTPAVRTAGRPWSSTPNLAKMWNRGSSSFQGMDLHLRPSASVWTNTSATRSTPGSAQPSASWQAALLREKRARKEKETSLNEITMEALGVRETMLVNDDVGTAEGVKDDVYLDEEHAQDVNRYRHAFAAHAQEISRSNHFHRPGFHRYNTSAEISRHYDLHRQHMTHESVSYDFSTDASPNHNLNLYCLSQFSESSLNNIEMNPKRQHRDKCTASLRNPEFFARSEFSNNIHFRKAQSHGAVGYQDTSFNGFEAKKQNQRYSIPRYDCFRIADYSDMDDHSSFQDASSQQDVLLDNGERFSRVERMQKCQSPRRRSYHGGPSWIEKLTDRQKLVLNLTSHQHAVYNNNNNSNNNNNNGATFTSLVGKRDENWHSNDNLISSQNLQQPCVPILSSPVESDAVLTFIELGCPVSHPEKRFDTEMGSPRRFYSPAVHAPPSNNQCHSGANELSQDKLLAEISNRFISQTSPDICKGRYSSRQSSLKDEASSSVIARKDHQGAVIALACPANDPPHLPRQTIGANPENRIRKKREESRGDVFDDSGREMDVNPGLNKNIGEYKDTETRTSLLQPGRQMLDVNKGENSNAFAITPLLGFYPDGRKQENRPGKNGDENGFRWSGMAVEERGASLHESYLKNIDENGNCNANNQSRPDGKERYGNKPGQNAGCDAKLGIKGTEREDLLKMLEIQNALCDGVDRGNLSEGDLSNSSYFCDDASDQDNISFYDPMNSQANHVRNQSLPLLCYNNSFGEKFQGLNMKYDNKPASTRNALGANHNGTLPSVDHGSGTRGNASGALSLCPDKIDATFHQALQSPMMESMGVSPTIAESIPPFRSPASLGGKRNDGLNSGKYAGLVEALGGFGAQQPDAGRVESPCSASPTSRDAKQRTCHEEETAASLLASTEMTNGKQRGRGSSNFPEEYSQDGCDQNISNLFDKMAWHSDQDDFYFDGLLPSVKNNSPLARNTVPLRILQARIIGRNISDFANICFHSDHKVAQSFQSITCTTSTPFSYRISSRQAEEDLNVTWAALKNAYVNASNNTADPLINSGGVNALTKSQLHSKYALTQAKLAGDVKQTSSSAVRLQTYDVDQKNHVTDCTSSPCQISDLTCLPAVNSSSNEGDFRPKINFSSSSPNKTCLPDVEYVPTFSLPQAFTSSSSAGEFTSQEDDGTTKHRSQFHHAVDRPSTMASKEGHSLINSQLSSSHSSDSLSCTLSTYSLANTLHSDTSNSDTCHNGAIYSDAPHSDAARYDSPHSDSSHSNTIGLSSQLHDSQGSIIQCLVSGPETQTLCTPPSNSARSTTPSSYLSSQSTHSPRSSPLSTISPHSSPCSQCTLSPHSSSSSSSPSHPTFQDARECLPDDQCHFYSTPPESASFSHNPSFFFPVSSYSSSPSQLEAHGAGDLGLSISTPSTSCRSTWAENPEGHKRQGNVDLADKSGLNLNEIQSSLGSTSCHCGKDRSLKWDKTLSERTSQEFQISPLLRLSRQNDDGDHNRSTLSDREAAWDSRSNKHSEGEGGATEMRHDRETQGRLCAIMGGNEIEALEWEQSRGNDGLSCEGDGKGERACDLDKEGNGERNITTCDENIQHTHDYEEGELVQSKSESNSLTPQSSNFNWFNRSNYNVNQINVEAQPEDTQTHAYQVVSDQNLELSTLDNRDDQSFETHSAFECTPTHVHDQNENESVPENTFRIVSQDEDTNGVSNCQQHLHLGRQSNNSNTAYAINQGDEHERNSPHFDVDSEAGKCSLTGSSSDSQSIDFTTMKAEEVDQERAPFANLKDDRSETGTCLHSYEYEKEEIVFSDNTEAGHEPCNLVGDMHHSSCGLDSECFADGSNDEHQQNERVQEVLTSPLSESPDLDGKANFLNETERTTSGAQSDTRTGASNTVLPGQCGLFAEMNGPTNQIDTETTEQIRADESGPERDIYAVSVSSNANGSEMEQSLNGDADESLSLPNVSGQTPGGRSENKKRRPKRKVQSLVQHFESVSLGGQAETSPFQ